MNTDTIRSINNIDTNDLINYFQQNFSSLLIDNNIISKILSTNDINILTSTTIYNWFLKPIPSDYDDTIKCKCFNIESENSVTSNKNDFFSYKPDIIIRSTKSQSIGRIINALDQDTSDMYPKYYTFLITNNGIKYGIVKDGLEYGVSHNQLLDTPHDKVIIGGEIILYDNMTIKFNFWSSLASFGKLSRTNTMYYDSEIVKLIPLILLTKKCIELSNIIQFNKIIWCDGVLFIETFPTMDEFIHILSIPQNKNRFMVANKSCTKKLIKLISDPEEKALYEDLTNQVMTGNITTPQLLLYNVLNIDAILN